MAPATADATARTIAAEHGNRPDALIEILHGLQAALGCVPEAAVPALADALNLSRAEVHGVVTFYHDFRREPAGRHVLKMCRAEACQSMGCEALVRARRGAAGRRLRRDQRRRPRHAGADLLPGPVRHGALGDDRRPRSSAA